MTLDEVLALETQVWEALVAGDADADTRLLSDDFLGVYPTGFAGRGAHAEQFASEPSVTEYSIADARLLELDPDTVLLSYRADYRRPASTASEAMYVSSLWMCRGGTWVNVFSQDTPAVATVAAGEGAT